MPRRSVAELTKIGLDALGANPSESEDRMVRAIAAMFSASGSPRVGKPGAALPVSPQAVFQQVAANGAILCDPPDNRWFGRLGGLLKNIRVEQHDVDVLLAWFDAGGVSTWPQGKPTFTHFLQHLDKWLAFSREWERRGRQQLGRGVGSVGAPVDSAPDLSSFRAPRL